MPNRILKEGICTNDQIDTLSLFEEVFFYRLIVNADDYGRYDGRIPVLKARMFPLRGEKVKDCEIERAIVALVKAGLLERYRVGGRPYVRLTGWERNQQIRAKKSKYPGPEEADHEEAIAHDGICNRPPEEDSPCEMEKTAKSKPKIPEEPAVVSLILNDSSLHGVTASDVNRYQELYPAVDVMQELRKMAGWCDDNPTKRKTKAGIRKFIGNWLSREQDRGGSKKAPQQAQRQFIPSEKQGGNPFKR